MKKILLAVSGLSPQIVTETLYSLAVQREKPFIPDEIHLVTTKQGAARARLQLLIEPDGWFHRLRKEYSLPPIHFPESNVHILQDSRGREIEDIRTPEHNASAADRITHIVSQLTSDESSVLHVSIAGGRKTMGFYLGYALSLFGRPQDELSHVLVSEPYESLTDFFYPSRSKRVIYTKDNEPLDASEAKVWLANIPFVRMRHGVPEGLKSGDVTFSAVVGAASMAFEEPRLEICVEKRLAICGDIEVSMPPAELAFYTMMAERRMRGQEGLSCPKDMVFEQEHADHYLYWYREINKEIGGHDRSLATLKKGMSKSFFEQRKSNCNKCLRKFLSTAGSAYEISRTGKRLYWRYGLSKLPKSQIKISRG